MKTRIFLTGVGLVTVFALSCAAPGRYNPHAVATTPRDIKGNWIGYDQDCLVFYRLTFADAGKGVCIALFADDTPDVHPIRKWEIKDDGLVLELAPATSGAEPITMEVVAVDQREMRVRVKGVERSWSHHASLHREDDVFKRAKMAKQVARKTKWQTHGWPAQRMKSGALSPSTRPTGGQRVRGSVRVFEQMGQARHSFRDCTD